MREGNLARARREGFARHPCGGRWEGVSRGDGREGRRVHQCHKVQHDGHDVQALVTTR